MASNRKLPAGDRSIKDIPFIYKVLSKEEREYLEKNITIHQYKKGQLIYSESEEPPSLLCLASGKVKIFKKGISRREHVVSLIKAPVFLGHRALFADDKHATSAVAIDHCTIIEIGKDVVSKLIATNNQLCNNIIKLLAAELGEVRNRVVNLTQKHLRGRLAESLITLRDTHGFANDGSTLNIYLSREDLANFSNMTTSNAIRTLSIFVKENVITVNGRIIKLLDEEKLERISRLG